MNFVLNFLEFLMVDVQMFLSMFFVSSSVIDKLRDKYEEKILLAFHSKIQRFSWETIHT